MRTIYCHNLLHLGDCIETLHFLINATNTNDIRFNFYCNPIYHNQLSELIVHHTSVIELTKTIHESSIETWVAGYGDYAQINDQCIDDMGYTDQSKGFLIHWIRLSKMMNIICPFISKSDLIHNQSILSEPCELTTKYDYLFINSLCLSLIYDNFEQEGLTILDTLKRLGKTVITTRKILDFPCTLDYNLSVVKIGQLSKNVKTIIAANTGPIHLCMNVWTLTNIEKFINWTPSHNFNFGPKFRTVTSLSELKESEL